MKLKNKKTGEIRNIKLLDTDDYLVEREVTTWKGEPLSLAELNEEWEDYEEPKKYWFIDAYGNIVQNEITKHYGDEYTDMTNEYENQKQIGNYFKTREDAVKALEKLEAFQRLKDKGFRFRGISDGFIGFWFPKAEDMFEKNETRADLDLLFSGEDD